MLMFSLGIWACARPFRFKLLAWAWRENVPLTGRQDRTYQPLKVELDLYATRERQVNARIIQRRGKIREIGSRNVGAH